MLIFWCEFPERIDWQRLNKLFSKHNLKASVYIAAKSRQDFENKKKEVCKCKQFIVAGVWPVLPKEKGYWFSGFTAKEDIDLLDEFEGIDMKIDIEPPIPKKLSVFFWLTKYFIKKPKNREYLREKIRKLATKSKVILSTIPCPLFALRRYGFFIDENYLSCNFMHYSSLVPKFLQPFYRFYYRRMIRKRCTKRTFFALGLIGGGIFGNESVYKDVKEFEEDIKFLKENGVKNFVVYRLGAILERKNPDRWLEAIKKI